MTDKQRIDKLVDIYLNWLESLHHDAGWHSCGLLEKLKMPTVPPRPDLTDMKMVNEVKFLRRKHEDLPLIEKALDRLQQKDMKAWLAVLANRYYQHNYLDTESMTVKLYKDTNRAAAIGQSPRQFAKNRLNGYAALGEIIELLELGMYLKKSA